MKSGPLISVIVPAYNVEDFIAEALESILNQEEIDDFEVLVINDRSSDGTANIVKRYLTSDNRVKLYDSKRKQGPAGARNSGISHASGQWLLFLDADDVLEKDALRHYVACIRKYNKIDIMSADFFYCDNNERTLQTIRNEFWRAHFSDSVQKGELLFLKNPAFYFLKDTMLTRTGVLLVRSSFLNIVGEFDESLPRGEDWHMWIRLAKAAEAMLFIPKALLSYRVRPGSLSFSGVPSSLFEIQVYRKLYKDDEFRELRPFIRRKISQQAMSNTYHFRKKRKRLAAIASSINWLANDFMNAKAWRSTIAACMGI